MLSTPTYHPLEPVNAVSGLTDLLSKYSEFAGKKLEMFLSVNGRYHRIDALLRQFVNLLCFSVNIAACDPLAPGIMNVSASLVGSL